MKLELQHTRGSISPLAPPELAPWLHSLLPILHEIYQNSISGYSKGSRGLSVLLLVIGIFTNNIISPSPSLRQRSDRYAIRAGRNLPDKEFRYLRTVIVTAGLHRGFSSGLAPLPLTYRQWPGFSPYTSPFGLAGTCVFGKQSLEPFLCGLQAPLRKPKGAPCPEVTGPFCRVP